MSSAGPGHHTEQGVVVPRQALGRGVEHQVDAVVERTLHRGAGEGGVDDRDGSADRTDRVEIDERQGGVGRRLHEDDLRLARADGGRDGIDVRSVDEGDIDAEAGQVHHHQPVRDREDLPGGHDVVAR